MAGSTASSTAGEAPCPDEGVSAGWRLDDDHAAGVPDRQVTDGVGGAAPHEVGGDAGLHEPHRGSGVLGVRLSGQGMGIP